MADKDFWGAELRLQPFCFSRKAWPRKIFFYFFGKKRGFSHFVLHVKHWHRGLEVKRPFNLFHFGQESVFLEESVFKIFPEKL